MDNQILVNNIKTLCVQNQVKISTLEEAIGVTKGRIAKWTTANPSIDKVEAVAKYFNVSIDSLLHEPNTRALPRRRIVRQGSDDYQVIAVKPTSALQSITNTFPAFAIDNTGRVKELDIESPLTTVFGPSKTKINASQLITLMNSHRLIWHKITTYDIRNSDVQKLYDSLLLQDPYLDCFISTFRKSHLIVFQSIDEINNDSEHNKVFLYIQANEESYPLLVEEGEKLLPLAQEIYKQTKTQSVYDQVTQIIKDLNSITFYQAHVSNINDED